MLRRLLDHGASPDVADIDGYTPLMMSCYHGFQAPGNVSRSLEAFDELMRRLSPATRRAVTRPNRFAGGVGLSAVDCLVRARNAVMADWKMRPIGELLVAGASVQPRHASVVLPIAVSHGLPLAAHKEAELAARRAEPWRGHEAMVGLALDFGELKAAQQEEEDKQRRVLELEMELRELRVGTESSSSSSDGDGDSGESEEGDDEDEEEE
jgi:hypothetical protein